MRESVRRGEKVSLDRLWSVSFSGGEGLKRIVIHFDSGSSKVALLEDGRLAEFYIERPADSERAGNIYKGRVTNVLPGMQCAFIDIGLEKNAYLYRDDLLPAHIGKQPADKPSITEMLKPGQELVVQVKKEPAGAKGARVTTHFTIPGRWIVYMPDADYVAVSRKIQSDEERQRLKQIGEGLISDGDGIIVRTVAEGQPSEALRGDWELLRRLWDSAQSAAKDNPCPSLLYRDLDMIPRLVRDLFTDHIDEIVIDNEETGNQIIDFLRTIAPGLASRVKIHRDAEPILFAYPIAQELDKAYHRKIRLESGGYVVIDHTEALTVIDVNTGRFTGEDDLEETVFATNLEAASEILRLLRLRDIGGMIVVDFIDMIRDEHRQTIKKRMEEMARLDRTRTLVVGWTRLGLFELTRKKQRQALDGQLYDTCPYCSGLGKVFSKHHPFRMSPSRS